MAWEQRFYDPIPLPDGRELVTLRDAAGYFLALSAETQALPHWVTALETLLLVGDGGGDPLLPRIAMMQALHHGEPPPPRREKRTKKYNIIR